MTRPLLDAFRPSPLEVAVAALYHQVSDMAPLDLDALDSRTPRQVIEQQVGDALRRGPVWVLFSGGRDSSALLAIATSVARRDGLELPIPITMVFPEVRASDEGEWQRLVLDHLGLTDRWVRKTPGTDLDMIGPYAQRVLRQYGVVIPPNAHAVLPMFDEMGAGATLLSGSNGDELMEGRPQRITSALLSRRRVLRDEVASSIIDDLPGPLQAWAARRFSVVNTLHWLTARALRAVQDLELEERALAPIRYDRLMQRAYTDRQFQSAARVYDQFAADVGSTALVPFATRDVVAATARHWGYRFPGQRSRSLEPLVGDLLPARAITRSSKAEFANVFATEQMSTWVREWDGTGVDPSLVDVARLRAEWASPMPHYCSLALLQQAWLASESRLRV